VDLAVLSAEELAERAQHLAAELAAVHAALAVRLRLTSEERRRHSEEMKEAERITPAEWAKEAGIARESAYRIARRQGWTGHPVRRARSEWRSAK